VDFGDHASSTLTARAWEAYNRGALDEALPYIAKCIELYEAEARTMQQSLTAFPSGDSPEIVHAFWALNDVGTSYFLKGEILLKQGDRSGAIAAFDRLARDFSYAQCWDPKGWFWRPGEAARQKVVEMQFDAE
jgi:tetratricopeptide (TPR) repeat protein